MASGRAHTVNELLFTYCYSVVWFLGVIELNGGWLR